MNVVVVVDDDDAGAHDVVVVVQPGCFDTLRSVVDGKNDSHTHCSPCEKPIRKDSCNPNWSLPSLKNHRCLRKFRCSSLARNPPYKNS